jgi:hypothetical protein
MRLTDATVSATYDPVWSPDGTEIIYIETEVDSYIVKSNVPFDQQKPRPIPKMTEKDGQVIFRAFDWNANGIAGIGLRLYSPATNVFESLVIGGGNELPRWMHDARRLYYGRGGTWFVLDPKTLTEQRISGSEHVDVDQLVLSADSRRAYVLSGHTQSDVWRMDIK